MMIKKTIQVQQKDSAFVYAILESLEGMAAYSTLKHSSGSQLREIELLVPESFQNPIEQIIEGLRKKIPVINLD